MNVLVDSDGVPLGGDKPSDWRAELAKDEAKHKHQAQKWLMPLLIGGYVVLLVGGVGLAYWVAPALETDEEAERIKDLTLCDDSVLAGSSRPRWCGRWLLLSGVTEVDVC